jgi:hypothetical protein
MERYQLYQTIRCESQDAIMTIRTFPNTELGNKLSMVAGLAQITAKTESKTASLVA